MIRNKKEFERVFLGPKWGYNNYVCFFRVYNNHCDIVFASL